MHHPPPPRRTATPSRAALAVASLAAGAAFAIAVVIAGPWSAPIADAAVAFEPVPVVVDTSTGERVVVDTVYVTAPDPAALADPASDQGEREHGDDEHEGADD